MAERGTDDVECTWVACSVCGADDAEPLYRRVHETGSILGRFEKTDVLCRACGFMYTNPRPTPEVMQQYYASASGASGSIYHGSESGSRLHSLVRERARFIARLIDEHGPTARASVLDVGCSVGDLLVGLGEALPGWRRVGLEPSESAARFALERGLEVATGDLETSLPEDRFELVCCISALEHVFDPRIALERLLRVLAPGGLLVLEVPDSTRPIAQVAEFYSFEHLSHFTRSSLAHCLREVGLEPIAFDDEVGIPNLRVCARRIGEGCGPAVEVRDERERLREAVAGYALERARFENAIVERLSPRIADWRERGERVAVYGAGMHTRFLADLLDLRGSVACVLDGDARKAGQRFLGWPVYGPNAIPALALDAILISTHAFEDEVYAAIAPTAAACGIDVVRCYA